VAVAEDLHLDMAGAQDHLFEIALAVAECRLGLAAALEHLFLQLVGAVDRAHAAPAAAPRRLEHQRIADLAGGSAGALHVLVKDVAGGDDGHARLDGDVPGAGLVAKRAHGVGLGADERDPRRRAGIDEIGVL
jgi:hypothetical protein